MALLAATVACALALAAAAAPAALAATAAVAMRSVQFDPRSVTIDAGDSVTWTNLDGIPHSAAADNGSFDTGVFSSGSRTVTLPAAGTYPYHCAVHPTTMTGTITVRGPTPPPPPPPTAPPPPPPTTAPPPPATVAPTAPPVVTRSPEPTVTTAAATPTVAATPSPAATTSAPATATPSPSAALVTQASPAPSPRATNGQQGGEGGVPLLPLIVLGAGLLVAGAAFALRKRA